MSDHSLIPSEQSDAYERLLQDLREIIIGARTRSVAAVNTAIVDAYWHIGKRIVEDEQQGALRAGYGERVIERLGRVLSQELGRGFSAVNLRSMRRFYLAYPIRQALPVELSWTHINVLLRLPDELRDFYERMAVRGRWSSRELERQVNSELHVRVAHSRQLDELTKTLPSPVENALTYDDAFKDPYILDFLGLKDVYREKDLEAALVVNIEKFLLELGTGFCFVGRQQRLTIDDKDYYVDLVFYHRKLKCIVLVDLKIGAFESADAAQMQLYLEWFKRYDKAEDENDPIGLILCGSKGRQVVELLLSGPGNRIKVSQYLLLDSEDALKQHLARMSELYEQLHGSDDPESGKIRSDF